jgi:prolyl-tRNA editing enzyme YbaK/EbsC (Cys-tRNA(Pro) deacylase)
MASVSSVLDEAGVDYELLSHTRTERAADEATALGLPPMAVAKTLVVAAPEGHVRVVLPASERIDLRKLRDYVEGGKRIRLASEDELARAYPEFDLGAVPPSAARATIAFSSMRGSRASTPWCSRGARTSNRSGSRQATC